MSIECLPYSSMDLMWLFTVPVLKLAIKVAILLSALFLIVQIIRWAIQATPPNPFMRDVRQPRKPYVHDQKKRDAVLKQGFSMDKVKRLKKLCCSITTICLCRSPVTWMPSSLGLASVG